MLSTEELNTLAAIKQMGIGRTNDAAVESKLLNKALNSLEQLEELRSNLQSEIRRLENEAARMSSTDEHYAKTMVQLECYSNVLAEIS